MAPLFIFIYVLAIIEYNVSQKGGETMKKKLIPILAFVFILILATVTYASTNDPKRLAGNDRYETAVSIAQDGWQQSDYAILANGENYPDALSAAPLAKKYNAPILLTNGSSLSDATKQTLVKLQVKNVFIIGGTGVISTSIETELQSMGIAPTRIAGQDRYDTAIQVAKQITTSPSTIFVVTGEDYPDALSVAPIAAIKQYPIIIVPNDYMPDSVKSYLSDNGISKTYVMGDTDIVSDNVFSQLPNAERIKGADKYTRNINANVKFNSVFTTEDVTVATGEGFADALAGTSYAAMKSTPIVLVNSYPPSLTRIYTVVKLNMANTVKGHAYVLGGQGVVSDSAIAYLYTLPDTNKPDKPSTPTNLVATAISDSAISIQWDPISDADYYFVYLCTDGKTYIPIYNNDLSKWQLKWLPNYSFTLTGISINTTDYFKVTAVKNGVESDYSNVAYATTLSIPALPVPAVTTPILTTPDTVESSIDGEFNGWTGETIFKLQNGQIWEQSSYAYWYHYAYSPKVLIYKSGSVYKMKVDGVDSTINVTRIK